MNKLLILILLSTFTLACSKNNEDLKSPCVSLDNGPCGPKKPVNVWLS
jgi:hypothetical protein